MRIIEIEKKRKKVQLGFMPKGTFLNVIQQCFFKDYAVAIGPNDVWHCYLNSAFLGKDKGGHEISVIMQTRLANKLCYHIGSTIIPRLILNEAYEMLPIGTLDKMFPAFSCNRLYEKEKNILAILAMTEYAYSYKLSGECSIPAYILDGTSRDWTLLTESIIQSEALVGILGDTDKKVYAHATEFARAINTAPDPFLKNFILKDGTETKGSIYDSNLFNRTSLFRLGDLSWEVGVFHGKVIHVDSDDYVSVDF